MDYSSSSTASHSLQTETASNSDHPVLQFTETVVFTVLFTLWLKHMN